MKTISTLLSVLLMIALGTTAKAQGRYAEHSVLREGNWAKISVAESGFYELTDVLIKKAGFSDASHVKIYGYGGALQPERLTGDYLSATDDLQELPTCTMNGKRVFYGVGTVNWNNKESLARTRNPYADYGYYFLTESDGEPLTTDSATLVGQHYPANHDYHQLYEVDNYAWYHGGRNLFDKTLYTIGTPQTYKLKATGSTGRIGIALTADADYEATISINDSVVATISKKISLDSYTKADEQLWQYQLTNLKADNTISITQTAGGNLRLDYIDLQHAEPAPITIGEPAYVYRITNQDHHADAATDMVMIIPTSQHLLAQAERLKAHHEQHDGLRVTIVPADELYNEFSSGTPDAIAYRRYLKMLYDRATTDSDKPRYLLLFGDGAWDNRMRTNEWSGYNPDDYLLCYESENSFSQVNCYVSDDFFCLLDDEEVIQTTNGNSTTYAGKPDVAVGRLPARTPDEAKTLVDKIISYAQNEYAGPWQNEICMMGDDGNDNSHMKTADKVATMIESTYPNYNVDKIYWDAYQRTSSSTGYSYPDVTRLIKQQLQNGALMMNYCGHGAAYAMSHELVMKLTDFESQQSNYLPLWMTASCDIMPFDGQEENIGETVMLNSKGGGIAFFGTTRTVYATYNEVMNLAFTKHVLTPGMAIGEAVRLAKCELVEKSSDMTCNKLQYTLLGDPALQLNTPQQTMVVDSINGQPATEGIKLAAGSIVKITGHVELNDETDTDFNGIVTLSVRDAEETITCRLNDQSSTGADKAFVYQDRTNYLYRGSENVTEGIFYFTFAIPKDISYTDGSGLMTLYAINADKTRSAHGENESFELIGSSTALTDSIGPSVYCYLNSKNFKNGSKVNTTPYFIAELYDDSGINASGSSIGHDLELIIDGDMNQTYNLNNYFEYDFGDYRSGSIGFSIPELSVGTHKLLFRAWDILNNSTTTELLFEVSEDAGSGEFNVTCTQNPASTDTQFVITHDRPGSELKVTLDVFDLGGRQLWRQTDTVMATNDTVTIDWNLNVAGGSRLHTGLYLCRLTLNDGDSKTIKLLIKH
ncbi:Por secretion system C-terminal sorting domain-containing protein [Xylanibacter ruminicola]|uniref:Por secretion system C-terminal sorting domain-containing protein n=1 Tax=Xylanibacter ruminicola TaxID=839 RepID=A0A1H3XJ79_XYLRU|nr:type IX secretion system sortase PorU [Xylanibacter ruminicola]SDZ99505.1 Por secretion system C-terminal sorting domain-containing protein [Xylanibacter ruminicola]